MQKAMSVLQLRFEEGRGQETSTRLLDFVFDETESGTANSSRDTAWSGQANAGFSDTVITVYVVFMRVGSNADSAAKNTAYLLYV